MKACLLPLLLVLGLGLASCRAAGTPFHGPYAPITEGERDPALAQALNGEAAELMQSEPERAETLLRQALTADLFFGPAHNNLGVVYLKQGKLYEAAGELEWARKLLPGHPDPRVNLGLVFEAAGRNTQAMESYQTALEVYPGYLPALQGAARVMAGSNRQDERLRPWLEEIALRADEPGWREWARGRLAAWPAGR